MEAADSPKCSKIRVIFAVVHINVEFEDKSFLGKQAFFFAYRRNNGERYLMKAQQSS
jgi:hypothetical protein